MCKSTKYQIFSGFSFAPLSFARLTCAHRQTAAHFTSNLFRALSFTRTPSRSTRSYCSCLCVRFSLHCCCYCCFYCTLPRAQSRLPALLAQPGVYALLPQRQVSFFHRCALFRLFVCLCMHLYVCVCWVVLAPN